MNRLNTFDYQNVDNVINCFFCIKLILLLLKISQLLSMIKEMHTMDMHPNTLIAESLPLKPHSTYIFQLICLLRSFTN
ncbi:hypothetical protein PPBDW_II0489 [Photobacterium kishitanii]|nr:hypothetical protein PPBDW_II0489 [Photobacterium kishitanii]